MKGKTRIKYLFVDIGGVLLTDGWIHEFRKLAAKKFDLDPEEMEKRHIISVLRRSGGNKAKACRLLGISRPTLDRKISKFGIEIDRMKGS